MTSTNPTSQPTLTDAQYAILMNTIPVYEVESKYVCDCKRILRVLSLITLPNPSAFSWLMHVIRAKPSAFYDWDVNSSPKRHFISVYPIYAKYYVKAGGNPEMVSSISYDSTFHPTELYEIDVIRGYLLWSNEQTEESRRLMKETMGKYYMTPGIDINDIDDDMTRWISTCIERAVTTITDVDVRNAVVGSYRNYISMVFINAGSSETFDGSLIASLTKHTKFSKVGQFMAEFGINGRLILGSIESLMYVANLEMPSSLPDIDFLIDPLREMLRDVSTYQTYIRDFNVKRLEAYRDLLPHETKLADPQDRLWDGGVTNDDVLNYLSYNLVPYNHEGIAGYYVRGMPHSAILMTSCLADISFLDRWGEALPLPPPGNLKDTIDIMNSHTYYISARNKTLEGMKEMAIC